MTRTQELAVQALNDRGFTVARCSTDGVIRFASPAIALNASDFLGSLGVYAPARLIGGQWALEVR